MHREETGAICLQHRARFQVSADACDAVLVGIGGVREPPTTRIWLDAHHPIVTDRWGSERTTPGGRDLTSATTHTTTQEAHTMRTNETRSSDRGYARGVYVPGIVVVILLVVLLLAVL